MKVEVPAHPAKATISVTNARTLATGLGKARVAQFGIQIIPAAIRSPSQCRLESDIG